MSRWFPDSLKVRVAAEALEFQLTAAKEARAWNRMLEADQAGVATADAVCAALDAELQALAALHLKIDVTLQAAWVRYCLIPWNADLTSPSDRASFVQHCFHDIYGEMTRRWTVQASQPAFGKMALGAAIDSALLSGLARSAGKSGNQLVGVRPELTERMTLARRAIRGDAFWFVLADASSYTLLLIHAGSPAAIQTVGRPEANLETLLERAWRSAGLDQPRCPVYADVAANATIELGQSPLGWRIERLPTVLPRRSIRPVGRLSKLAS